MVAACPHPAPMLLWPASQKLAQAVSELAARERRLTLNIKRKRQTPQEIIEKLREAARPMDALPGVEEVCKKLEVSAPTSHRWRQEYGGTEGETIKRRKAVGKKNRQVKKLVAGLSLDKAMLKEMVEVKW